ncbi:MAG: hypothetical protein R3D98_04540 [Candidatus Krumholzibacteriia bacterium]
MRVRMIVTLLAIAAMTAAAADLESRRPSKPTGNAEINVPDAAVVRQGGDTIADAVPLTVPYDGGGTTTGYTDDYDIF